MGVKCDTNPRIPLCLGIEAVYLCLIWPPLEASLEVIHTPLHSCFVADPVIIAAAKPKPVRRKRARSPAPRRSQRRRRIWSLPPPLPGFMPREKERRKKKEEEKTGSQLKVEIFLELKNHPKIWRCRNLYRPKASYRAVVIESGAKIRHTGIKSPQKGVSSPERYGSS